ncbi:MAG: hypothetical protein V3T07_06250, partial [Myxococcota bacterium]
MELSLGLAKCAGHPGRRSALSGEPPVSELESITLRASGLSFSALAAGSGPTVLCLHGFPDHKGSFRHQLPALAEAGYRAV